MTEDLSQAAKLNGRLTRLFNVRLVRTASVPALRMAAAFLQFIATVWIGRTLEAEKSGDFFFWSGILMTLGQAAAFGLDGLALQQVPRLHEDSRALSRFLGPIRVIAMLFSALLGLGCIGYALIAQGDISRSVPWYLMLPLCMAGIALCRINGETMKGMGHPMLAIMYRQFIAGAIFLLALLAMGGGLTSETAMFGYAAAFAITGFLGPGGPGFKGLAPHFSLPAVSQAARELKRGFPIFISAAFVAANYIIPLAILERYHNSESVAFLTTAYRLFMLFDLLALAIHSIAMPQLSRAGHAKDWALTAKVYRNSIKNGLLVLGIPLLGSIVAAAPIMSMFGDSFVPAAPVLRAFLVFGAVSLLMGPANELVLMMGHTGRMATFAMARMAATVLLSLYFVPHHGAIGMAIAVGIGILLQKGLCLWHFRRHSVNYAGA